MPINKPTGEDDEFPQHSGRGPAARRFAALGTWHGVLGAHTAPHRAWRSSLNTQQQKALLLQWAGSFIYIYVIYMRLTKLMSSLFTRVVM